MKLQINLAGSWRDILHFEERDLGRVQHHAKFLLKVADGKASMRVADDKNVSISHLEGPDYVWR